MKYRITKSLDGRWIAEGIPTEWHNEANVTLLKRGKSMKQFPGRVMEYRFTKDVAANIAAWKNGETEIE